MIVDINIFFIKFKEEYKERKNNETFENFVGTNE
jgi:hypothetical protein